jgi:hypothetical protein
MVQVKKLASLAVAAGLVLVAASPALAQRWGRERWSRDGVCFYQDVDFRGEYFCIRSGEDLRSLPGGMNDQISSLRIFGRTEVTVFRDDSFHGRSTTFDGNVRDLRLDVWNDRISSIRVRGGGGRGRGNDRDDRGRGRGRGDAERDVRRAYRDLLDREPDAVGLRLYVRRMEDDGWSDAQVRAALRDSREYRERNTMTRSRAEEIVRNAYRSVLRREPDGGSRGYVDRVLRDHWTQADVERELRRSPEYRNR